MSLEEARRRLFNGNYYGSCMVARGDVDALVSGMTTHYPETIRPALEVIGAHPKAGLVSGMYMLVFSEHVVFCADTTVNIDPTAEQLAQIGYAASRITRTFGVEPRVAMLSFSNFGSVRHPEAEKMAKAVKLLRQRDPTLIVEGEMQADTALDPELLQRDYPIGPILIGMNRPVHVLERGADVQAIVNMAAVAVIDSQARSSPVDPSAQASSAPGPAVYSRS